MFSLNIWLTGEIIVEIALSQLLIVTFLGWSFGKLIQYYYTNFTLSYQVINQKNYSPNANGFPKKYRFVVVKYGLNSELKSETFYTLLGDWTRIEYLNGKCSSISTFFFSNFLLILFPLFGILLLIIANSQDLATNKQTLFHLLDTQMLKSCGELFFIPTFISGAIKLVFDFSYTKL